MTVEAITGVSCAGLVVYAVCMFFLMRWTFGYKNTLNYYIFQRQLQKNKPDVMHYVEVFITILTFVAVLTTLISLIQTRFAKGERSIGQTW